MKLCVTIMAALVMALFAAVAFSEKASALAFPSWCQSADGSFPSTPEQRINSMFVACVEVSTHDPSWTLPTAVRVRDHLGNRTEGYIVYTPDGTNPGDFAQWHRPEFVAEFDNTKLSYWPFHGVDYQDVGIRDNFLPYGSTASVYVWSYTDQCLDSSSSGPGGQIMYGPKEMALYGPYNIRAGAVGGLQVQNIIFLPHFVCFDIAKADDDYAYGPNHGWNCPISMCGTSSDKKAIPAKRMWTSCKFIMELCDPYVIDAKNGIWPYGGWSQGDRDADRVTDKYDVDGGKRFNPTGVDKGKDPTGKFCGLCNYYGGSPRPADSVPAANAPRLVGINRIVRDKKTHKVLMVVNNRAFRGKVLVQNRKFCIQTAAKARGRYKTIACGQQRKGGFIRISKRISVKGHSAAQCKLIAKRHGFVRIVFPKTKSAKALIIVKKAHMPKC